jgi:hypothetical protein
MYKHFRCEYWENLWDSTQYINCYTTQIMATLSTLQPHKPVILCAELLKPHIQHVPSMIDWLRVWLSKINMGCVKRHNTLGWTWYSIWCIWLVHHDMQYGWCINATQSENCIRSAECKQLTEFGVSMAPTKKLTCETKENILTRRSSLFRRERQRDSPTRPARIGRKSVNIVGDVNCLFRSVSIWNFALSSDP